MIKTLLFSTLYPSSIRPLHGVFVETRLRELLKCGTLETKVVAPVPWFPLKLDIFGEYGDFARTPKYEIYNGIEIFHPRYFIPPKIGINIAPYSLARAAIPIVKSIISNGYDFDLIDAHYYYPDGVAAWLIAREIRKPFLVTARGTDLNLIANYKIPRQLIVKTAKNASASIGVCKALMDQLANLGADLDKLHTLRNGVDLNRFHPIDRIEARTCLGLAQDRRVILSVGHLIERKGHNFPIEAIAQLPETILAIVGAGPELQKLKALARKLGVYDRVIFVGQVQNELLKWWYSAADCLALCSSREGWANVLLESMACGTPVIATNIWGTPEIVNDPNVGLLIQRGVKDVIAAALELFENPRCRIEVRSYAERFSWEATSEGQLKLMQQAIVVHS